MWKEGYGYMTAEAFLTLLEEAKNYLDITWDDEQTDLKLTGILRRGMAYLDEKAGAVLDYSEEGQPKALLFDYARYARANALDEFQNNYLSDIVALHLNYRVKEATANAETETPG